MFAIHVAAMVVIFTDIFICVVFWSMIDEVRTIMVIEVPLLILYIIVTTIRTITSII